MPVSGTAHGSGGESLELVRASVAAVVGPEVARALTPATPLSAVMDSFALVTLLRIVEERLGMPLPAEGLRPADLATPGALAVWLERLRAGR